MRPWGLLAGLACALAVAPAHAAITVSTAERAGYPGVGVDPEDGTGHLAWSEDRTSEQDLLHYCRLPRGATTCARTESFAVRAGYETFGAPVQVLVPSPGRVLILQYRCCGSEEGTYLVESGDGGTTFSAPRLVGNLRAYDATFGPGEFSVALTNHVDAGGIRFQAAPIDGSAPAKASALLGGDGGQWYYGTTGMLDPLTPLVAFGDLDSVFYRAKDPTKGPDPNDVGNWSPIQRLGKGDEPILAGGPRGVYLLHSTDTIPNQYVVRAYDRAAGTFGAATAISERAAPIFRDFEQDAGGGLTAVWVDNRDDSLRYRTSADGRTWRPIGTADGRRTPKFHLQVDTAADGGGFVIWDRNGEGPIEVAPIPPRGPAAGGGTDGEDCLPKLTLKPGIAVLPRNGACLFRIAGSRYGSDGDVRINGLDFLTEAGDGSARAAGKKKKPGPKAEITFDIAGHKVETAKDVEIRAGPILLDKGGLKWDADVKLEFAGLEEYSVKLFGFPITGEADVEFVKGGVRIPVNVKLPSFLSGVSGGVTLRATTGEGLKLEGIQIKVPKAEFGILEIRDLAVSYQGAENKFEGEAGLVFPPQKEKGIEFGFGFKNGEFAHAEVEAGPPVPPFPLALTAPTPLFLNKVGIAVDATKGLRIAGGVELLAGREILGTRVISIDALPSSGGGFILDFPSDKDWALIEARGKLLLVNLPLVEGFVSFRTDGLFKFGARVPDIQVPLGLPLVRVGGGVQGFIHFGTGEWLAGGKIDLCVPALCPDFTPLRGSAELLASSLGVVACLDVGPSIGAGYKWKEAKFKGYSKGCDVAEYTPAGGASAAQAGGASGVTLEAGLPQANFAMAGAPGAPPRVILTGPGGRGIASDADANRPLLSDGIALFTQPEAGITYVAVDRPAAGRWEVAAQEGSTISEVRLARGLPEVSVEAEVRGAGRRRTLFYDAARIPGQTVRFLERAAQVGRPIGTVRGGGRGRLSFAPGDGPAGQRSIVAIVEQDGLPRDEITVARYRAPGPRKAAKPGFLRVRRKGSRAIVTWGRSANAAAYDVRVRLSSGRSTYTEVPLGRPRRLVVRGVERDDRLTVTVNGERANRADGPARRATLPRARR